MYKIILHLKAWNIWRKLLDQIQEVIKMSSYISVELGENKELVVRCENCTEDQESLKDDIVEFTKGVLGI